MSIAVNVFPTIRIACGRLRTMLATARSVTVARPPARYRSWIVVAVCGFVHMYTCAQSSNAATQFWFAPPDVTDLNHSPGGVPIHLMIAAADTAAVVTVDQPANGSFMPIIVNVAAGGAARIDVSAFQTMLESRPTNAVLNSGLHVTATAPVTVYYELANTAHAAIWSLKGAEALGQEFYIPLQKFAPFFNESSYSAPHQAFASFDIVATLDNTQVTIYAPVALDGHPPMTQFTLTLNRGQAYSAGFTGPNWYQPSTHPAGAAVLADKPVAISLKDDSVHNPFGTCQSLMGDQIVPLTAIGTDYIATKGLLDNGAHESVGIVATQIGTQIFINGAATPLVTMFAGEFYRYDMDYLGSGTNHSVYLHASQPIYAMHISGFGCQMASASLPALNAGSTRVDFVRSDAQSFQLVLLSPTAAVNGFSIVGPGTATIPALSFSAVPGTAGAWMAARIAYDTTQVPVDAGFHVSNPLGRFALGILAGDGTTAARYAYLSQFTDRIFADGFD